MSVKAFISRTLLSVSVNVTTRPLESINSDAGTEASDTLRPPVLLLWSVMDGTCSVSRSTASSNVRLMVFAVKLRWKDSRFGGTVSSM